MENADNTWTPEGLTPLRELPRTGGQFLYSGRLSVPNDGRYVLDFAHTALIARFEHRIHDSQGRQVGNVKGGIESPESNFYPFRHGHPLQLATGDYHLYTYVESPYFITPPGIALTPEADYLQAIKSGNAISLIALGIFIAMGALYLCFAITRSAITDLAYAVFIGGNLLFFSVTLNVLPDLFGGAPFVMSSWPLFVSNMAYIVFVMSLLGINRNEDPILFLVGRALLGLFAVFAVLGLVLPHWALELCRIGVLLFLCYGLSAGVDRVLQGNKLARYYLSANICFMVPAAFALASVVFLDSTIYSGHIGVIAVATEVLLLSLVQSYRMNEINSERLLALERAEKSRIVARTDSLTGAPNRHAFEETFSKISLTESFTYIDLDGLKYYNDHFGHHRGDELIRDFAIQMMQNLPRQARFYRIAGDEFGVVAPSMESELVAACINKAVENLKAKGYSLCGASFGQAALNETDSRFNLKKIADARMYAMKERKKKAGAL